MIELGTMGRSNSKVTAADGPGFVHVGKGDAVAAREIAKAKGDGKDNLVVLAGQDVYAASSSRIKTEWAADANRFPEAMTIQTPAGEKLAGAILLQDREASKVIEKKEAEQAYEKRRRESLPFLATAGVAVVAGALLSISGAMPIVGGVLLATGGAAAYVIARVTAGP
jgi:hypothetical protein